MKFTVELYETSLGRCPVLEFLDDLKESNADDFAAVMAGLSKLQAGIITDSPFQSLLVMTFLSSDM